MTIPTRSDSVTSFGMLYGHCISVSDNTEVLLTRNEEIDVRCSLKKKKTFVINFYKG